METRKTLKRASESSVFVLSCTKTSGDKSLSFICYNDISGKMHRDNWNGKILCLKRWISLQKCLWCAIYWWVIIHRQVIVIKNYWHVPPSVNFVLETNFCITKSGIDEDHQKRKLLPSILYLLIFNKIVSINLVAKKKPWTNETPYSLNHENDAINYWVCAHKPTP